MTEPTVVNAAAMNGSCVKVAALGILDIFSGMIDACMATPLHLYT